MSVGKDIWTRFASMKTAKLGCIFLAQKWMLLSASGSHGKLISSDAEVGGDQQSWRLSTTSDTFFDTPFLSNFLAAS